MRVKQLSGSLLAFTLAIAVTSQARAFGAFAMGGNPVDATSRGVAVGAAVNSLTTKVATATALKNCRTGPTSPTESKALCKLVTTFRHEWLSIAIDLAPRMSGFGWSIDPDKSSAERSALDQCKVASPDDRSQYCVISLSTHDEKP
jgi:hypothetical protein